MTQQLVQGLSIPGGGTVNNPVTNPNVQSIGGFISALIPYVFAVAGILLFIYLLLGGYRFMTSGGNPEEVAKAREQIFAALIGFTIVFGSYFILQLAEVIFGFKITFIPVAYAQVDIGQTFTIGGGPIKNIIGNLTQTSRLTTLIVRFLFVGAMITFVFVLILGSLRYIFSGGDKNNIAGARSQLMFAIIGVVVVIAAYVIVKLIQEITGVPIV